MFRGGFAWLNAMQNMSGERQWKRKEIKSIFEYWSEMSRRSPGKRELLDSLTTREISLTRSYRNPSALIKWEISPVYWNRSRLMIVQNGWILSICETSYWEYGTAGHWVFWKPWPAVELKNVLSVRKHGFVFWAQRKPNTRLKIYKAFQDRLTCLNRHMIV